MRCKSRRLTMLCSGPTLLQVMHGSLQEDVVKKVWQKPVVVEQEVGLEVTSYSSAVLN